MQGMAGALREDYGKQLDAQALSYMEQITTASQRMDTMIRDLLAYSKITRTNSDLHPVDLHRAIQDARAIIGADAAQLNAEVQIANGFPNVIANPVLLSQVLANLLSNAIKFVKPGATPVVKVFAQESGGQVRVCVQDNGIGIAAEYSDKIFGMFERLHSAAEYPGTGIGLAIVKKAVQRMNGTLGFESTIGKGSCFWIDLPKA
jgi:signal transduction histidine kinase